MIDTATDSVVTRTKWERVFVATLHDGTVATYTVDRNGYPYVEIWKVRLGQASH
ncbi:MAG: hypothetical protein ACE5HT_16710 [Gemmatimonadales bacterium]